VAARPRFELLAHNRIEGDRSVFNGSPAVSGGRLFLRSDQYLYCFGEK
jgi:outer membrane protein assembly factor BamB